jgi:hypothetical protein
MPKRLILALVSIIVAVSLAAPTATAAVPSRTVLPKGAHLVTIPENSPQALPGGTYITFNNHVYLRNARTGKCMGVAGGSIGNGALVLQWTCAHIPGSDQQMHVRQYQTGNLWNVIDPSHSPGKCLGVAGSSQAPGAALVQWSCNQSETDQQFAFRVTNSNNPIRVEIFARHSEQAIGVAGANPNDGAQVVQWPWAGNNLGCTGDQCWDILLN